MLEENNIIGFLIYDIKNKQDKIMWIDQLIIDEKYRKKGYGKKLIENAEEIAKKENCPFHIGIGSIKYKFACAIVYI